MRRARRRVLARGALERLLRYAWPGNVRELENVIERAVVLSETPILELDRSLLPASAPSPESDGVPAESPTESSGSLEDVERRHILATLTAAGWVIEGPQGAARRLELHPNTLRSRMARLGIRRPTPDRS